MATRSGLTRAALSALAEEGGFELIFFDPPERFDHAILGLIHGFGQEPAVLYDEAAVLVALVEGGMSEEEAQEYFDFNTLGAFVGPSTPRFLMVNGR